LLGLNVLATLGALAMLKPTYLNMFGNLIKDEGQRFIFEMDQVMGALMSFPKHYSKVEACILLPGVIFTCFGWIPEKSWECGYLVIFGYFLLSMYMFICSVYAHIAKQKEFFYRNFCYCTTIPIFSYMENYSLFRRSLIFKNHKIWAAMLRLLAINNDYAMQKRRKVLAYN